MAGNIPTERLTAEQIAALPPAQKIEYARRFDQRSMPANVHDQQHAERQKTS